MAVSTPPPGDMWRRPTRVPRAPGMVADPALCPVWQASPQAGCACSGACIRPGTPEELEELARQRREEG